MRNPLDRFARAMFPPVVHGRLVLYAGHRKLVDLFQAAAAATLPGASVVLCRSDAEAFDFLTLGEPGTVAVIETSRPPLSSIPDNSLQILVSPVFPAECPDHCEIIKPPCSANELGVTLARALERMRLRAERTELQKTRSAVFPGFPELISRLDREWKRSLRYERWLSLLVMQGRLLEPERIDECLQRAADELFELPGGRYAALLPETNEQGALKVAGRIFDALGAWTGAASARPVEVYRQMLRQAHSQGPGSQQLLDQAGTAADRAAARGGVMHFSDLVDK